MRHALKESNVMSSISIGMVRVRTTIERVAAIEEAGKQIVLFATTLSMVFTTPGGEPTLGFPALSAMPGQFLLKDIVLLEASVWSLGESLKSLAA
jgi:uncharacterized membrane protein YkgB